jgi:hypothetical protein
VRWTYSGNVDPSRGIANNFIINEDGGNDSSFNGPNDIQASGSGSTDVVNDADTHTFNVQATDSWTIKVVSQP